MSSLSHRLPYGRLPSWQTDSAFDLAYHGTQSAYVLGETFLDGETILTPQSVRAF